MNKMRGFTIMELMIVLAIIGILAAWGIPSLRNLTDNNRLVGNANAIITSFQLARNEAITRAHNVSVNANAGGWQNGWFVKDETTGKILNKQSGPGGTVTIIHSSGATSFTYTPQGRFSGVAAASDFKLCDGRANETGRMVNLQPIGRVYVSTYQCT